MSTTVAHSIQLCASSAHRERPIKLNFLISLGIFNNLCPFSMRLPLVRTGRVLYLVL